MHGGGLVCMAGGVSVHGRGACVAGGACMAGETATAAGGTHPTGMHSCYLHTYSSVILLKKSNYTNRNVLTVIRERILVW